MNAKFDAGAALAQLVGSLPTLIAVLLAWIYSNARFSDLNTRFSDLNARIGDLNQRINDFRSEIKEAIKAEATLIRAELRRVEEVMDARLKHLEERER